jgi:arginine utilization regulatory protein
VAYLDLSRDALVEILDTIDEGIHAVNLTGETTVYNRAAARLDGLRPENVLGKHLLQSFPSLENGTSTLLQVLKTGKPIYNRPQTYTNYLGVKVHTVNTSLPILSDGHLVGALEVAKDFTQVKRLSEQVLELQAQVAGSAAKKGANRSSGAADSAPKAVYLFSHVLTEYPPLIEVKRRAEKASHTTSPILIYGETGTGKELLVQAIHNASPRQSDPFLALNCAALPASLLEGILFGTVRGSFTGAEDRAGLFELTNGGTLFLDEIQSMPLDLQAKLLRVLQEGELMRVGDLRVRRVDVRVITAANVLPEDAVHQGLLRSDLYFRINVVRFDLPPLRERRSDMDVLITHFIGKLNGRFGTHVRGVTEAVAHLFANYSWPGNVRELENALEAAMNLVDEGLIDVESLPVHLRNYAVQHGMWQVVKSDAGGGEGADAAGVDANGAAVYARGGDGASRHRDRAENPAVLGAGDRSGAEKSAQEPWVDALEHIGLPEFWHGIETSEASDLSWGELQNAFERIILAYAVKSTAGNVKQAAQLLRMPRQTLQYRLKQLNID